VRANDSPGVLARISLLFQRFRVNIDFVRFGGARSGEAVGLIVFRCPKDAAERLARKAGSLVDVLDLTCETLAPEGVPAARLPHLVGAGWTPRDFDDLMDSLSEELPAYAQGLTRRLREFHVTRDLVGVSPAVTREAAAHIEKLESENILLSRATAGFRPDSFDQQNETLVSSRHSSRGVEGPAR